MTKINIRKVIIADHLGFCMGVKRAISITEKTMKNGEKVTILNEIVHNEAIVKKFAEAGVGQSKSVSHIDRGTMIVSAHGASPEVFKDAEKRGLKVTDATCPLVIHIHKIIKKLAGEDYHIIHFGDPDHDETIGIVGFAPNRVTVLKDAEAIEGLPEISGKIALTAQTTAQYSDFLEIEKKLINRFPDIKIRNTICNATNQRQKAITELAPKVDIMLVVGSTTSANSKRLAQIAKTICDDCYLINSANEIRREWFDSNDEKVEIVGLSAGASTPDFLIKGAIDYLKELADNEVEVIYPPKQEIKNRLALDDND